MNRISRGAFSKILVSIFFPLIAGLTAQAAPIAKIDILSASPREVDVSPSDAFDETSSGLDVVGLGTKVYLQGEPEEGAVVGEYQWEITAAPGGSTATLSATTGQLVTFRPDKTGVFTLTLTPLDGAMAPTDPVTQNIDVSTFAGTGVFNTHATPSPIAPKCGTGFCHGGSNANPNLNVLEDWLQSKHSQKLQNHLNGSRGADYSVSCLPCHTLGFNENPAANNGGFDDAAAAIAYPLSNIPPLVALAVSSGVDQWPALPAELQAKASVQCESCHGPGTHHPSHLQETNHRIAGADLSVKACAQCHDATSGFEQNFFYQWDTSSHPLTADLSEGHVANTASCLKCHTGEGFVDVYVKGLPPTIIPDPNPVTCSTCHDPHFSPNEHQLRIVGDFTLDSGQTYIGPGKGGICMRCHNSRVSNPENTALTSSRGAHHGPQADMLLGVNGSSFSMGFLPNSVHSTVVADTCVRCHMALPSQPAPGGTEPPKVGSHTYAMRDTKGTADPSDDELNVANACGSCHPSLTDYDRPADGDYDGDGEFEGTQTEVRGLLDLLKVKLLALTGTSEDPVTGRIAVTSGGFTSMLADHKRALYNYNFVVEDKSLGVHNTSYAVQLLQRSYYPLYGTSILDDHPGIAVRGPIQKAAAAYWSLYE